MQGHVEHKTEHDAPMEKLFRFMVALTEMRKCDIQRVTPQTKLPWW